MKFPLIFAVVTLLFLALFPQNPAHAQTAQELALEGQRAYLSGDIETAKSKLSLALEIDPKNTTAQNFLRIIAVREAKSGGGGAQLEAQLKSLMLPRVELHDATFREALDFLKQQAAKQNVSVSIVSQLSPEAMQKPITLSLSNVPFAEALRYLCETNAAKFSVEKYAVVIKPAGIENAASNAAASVSPAAQ